MNLHVFHLQPTPADETTLLVRDALLIKATKATIYGPHKESRHAWVKTEAFTSTAMLAVTGRVFFERQLAAAKTVAANEPILLTDWAAIAVLPSSFLKAHRVFQLVNSLPDELPSAFKHAFAKQASLVKILTPNELIATQLVAWGVAKERIVVLPPPFEAFIKKESPNLPQAAGNMLVGVITRLEQNQGLETVLQAFQSILEITPTLKLILIGDGPDKRRMLWLIDQMHLRSRVQIATHSDGYQRFLNNLQVCLVPQTKDRGFSPIIAHAMAQGIPVVATAIPGHQDLIEHGKTGLLYTPGNSHVLSQHLINLYTHPDWVSHYQKIGPELIRNRFALAAFETTAAELLA